jgi:hypothetical protein
MTEVLVACTLSPDALQARRQGLLFELRTFRRKAGCRMGRVRTLKLKDIRCAIVQQRARSHGNAGITATVALWNQ